MKPDRRIAATGVVVVLVGAAGVVWLMAGPEGGVVAGAGPYGEDLLECRAFVDGELGHPGLQDYLEDTNWHVEAPDGRLRIGGKVMLLGGDGQPTPHNYECLMQNGHVLNLDLR